MNQTQTIIPAYPAERKYVPEHGFKPTQGDSLFQSGYRVVVRNECSLWVITPQDGTYVVSPYYKTCTCWAGQTGKACKHLKCLTELVFLTAGELWEAGKRDGANELFDFWFEYTAACWRAGVTA